MKYPKVWGSGPDTARIVGEARLRGLDQVGLPHLKASGPGFVASKLGATSEVHTEGGGSEQQFTPYVLLNYIFDDGERGRIPYIVGGRHIRRVQVAAGALNGVGFVHSVTKMVHVGDGYFYHAMIYSENGGNLNLPHYLFTVAQRLTHASGEQMSEQAPLAEKLRKNVTFNAHAFYYEPFPEDDDQLGQSALGSSLRAGDSVFASGYDALVSGYRFGWNVWQAYLRDKFVPPSGNQSVKTYTRVPAFYRTHTQELALTGSGAAYFPNRENLNSQVFCMGPGRLGYLLLKKDFDPVGVTWEPTYDNGNLTGYVVGSYALEAQAVPYLVVSEDHGGTWTPVAWNELNDLIFHCKQDTRVALAGRSFRNEGVETDLAKGTGIHYVGSGKTLIVVPRIMDGQSGINDSADGSYPSQHHRTALFRYHEGSITRLPWPPDTSYDQYVQPVAYSSNTLIRSFGEGCLALPCQGGPLGTFLLVTYDYGDTWVEKPLVGKLPIGASSEFVVLRPFRNTAQAGEIMFLNPTNGSESDPRKGVHAYVTDGNFTEFKYVGRIAAVVGDHTIMEGHPYGKSGVYVGENPRVHKPGEVEYPPYVNPAFPGEFDKP